MMKKLLLFFFFFALGAMQMWAGGPEGIQGDTVWVIPQSAGTSITFSPDGNNIATGVGDVFKTIDGTLLKHYANGGNYQSEVKYSFSGRYLAWCKHENGFSLIDTYGINPDFVDTIPTGGFAFLPNDSILITTNGHTLFYWNTSTGKLVKRIDSLTHDNGGGPNHLCTCFGRIMCSPLGDYIACPMGDGIFRLFNTQTDTFDFEYDYADVLECRYSHDGTKVALWVTNDPNNGIYILDVATKQITKIPCYPGIGDFTFSADDKYIIIGHPYSGIEIRNITNGDIVYSYKPSCSTIDISLDNKYLIDGWGDIIILLNLYPNNSVPQKIYNQNSIGFPNPVNTNYNLSFIIENDTYIKIDIEITQI